MYKAMTETLKTPLFILFGNIFSLKMYKNYEIEALKLQLLTYVQVKDSIMNFF